MECCKPLNHWSQKSKVPRPHYPSSCYVHAIPGCSIVRLFAVQNMYQLFLLCHLQTTWERTTDKKIQRNMVQRRVQGLLQQREYSLEERRDK